MPKINIMNENLETFFKDFSNIMKKIFFSDSSLKLETRFTLETTMKSGTQTKKKSWKKVPWELSMAKVELRHLIYAIYPVKFLFTKWIREFLTLKSRYVTMQAVIR